MKIAFIVTEYPKTTETFIMRDVMHFMNSGHDVRIFHLTPFRRNEVIHDFAKSTLEVATGYPFIMSKMVMKCFFAYVISKPLTVYRIFRDILSGTRRDPLMLLKSVFIFPKSARIATELREWQANHVHAAYAGHPATTAWIANQLEGIPFSVSSHAHDLFETQALLARKLPAAEFVRTISDYNRRFILKHVPSLIDRPPVVIHVGTDLLPASQRVPRLNGQFHVLYVGSLEFRKGVDTLLRAFAKSRASAWRLVIVGAGPERARLEALANRLDLGESVDFVGAKGNEHALQAMRSADVLVVPSRIGPRGQTEGLPTVIVEALSTKLPVIASNLTGIPEIVRHEDTGLLVEVDNVIELSTALSRVQADPQEAQACAGRGRILVEQEFDQRRNAGLLLAMVLTHGSTSEG